LVYNLVIADRPCGKYPWWVFWGFRKVFMQAHFPKGSNSEHPSRVFCFCGSQLGGNRHQQLRYKCYWGIVDVTAQI